MTDPSAMHVTYWTRPGFEWPAFRLSHRRPCLGIFGGGTCGYIHGHRICTEECNPGHVFDHGFTLLQHGRPVVMVGYPYMTWPSVLEELRDTCDQLRLYIDRHPVSAYGYGTTCFSVARRDTEGLHLLARPRRGLADAIAREHVGEEHEPVTD